MAIVFHDWREENKRRKYPFADSATASNDTLTLSDDLFFDGRLYPIGGNEDMFLSRITKTADDLTFAIKSDGTEELATAAFDLTDIPSNGELVFADSYGRPAGLLLSTQVALQAFSGLDVGTYEFLLEQTRFAAAVAVPQPNVGVRGIIFENNEIITGDVWLVGENGVVLRDDDGAIRVDIIGDPFAARKLCEDEEANDDEVAALQAYCPIRLINGIAPDDQGNFQLLVGSNQSLTTILRITPGSQAGSDVAEHAGNGSLLKLATLKIELLGQSKFRGL